MKRFNYGSKLKEHADIIAKRDTGITGTAITDNDGYVLEFRKYFTYSFSYMFLVSLAIENLIKGLLIYYDPSLITSGILSSKLKTYNFKTLHLYLKNKILNEGDADLLEEIQTSINSRGRYPILLSFKKDTPKIICLNEKK